jgi:predicted metal-binding protein
MQQATAPNLETKQKAKAKKKPEPKAINVAEYYTTQIRHYLSISKSLEERRREFLCSEEFHKLQCEQAYYWGLVDFVKSTQGRILIEEEKEEIRKIAKTIVLFGRGECNDCQHCIIQKACRLTTF